MAAVEVHDAVQGLYGAVLAFSTAVADRRAALAAGDGPAAEKAGDAGTDAWMKGIAANIKFLVDVIEVYETAVEERERQSVKV